MINEYYFNIILLFYLISFSLDACCNNKECAGFSFNPATGSGFYKGNVMCGFTTATTYEGYSKPGQIPNPDGDSADITITFADLNLFGKVLVYDIWANKEIGIFSGSYTSKAVAYHDTAFLRLSPIK